MHSLSRIAFVLGCSALLTTWMACDASAEELTPEDAKRSAFFESKIRPILVQHCYECHSADAAELKGSLAVDSAMGLRKGGDSGAAVVPGKPEESVLLEALRYDGSEMPPAGKLPDGVIDDFEAWIADGAFDPRTAPAASHKARVIDIAEGKQFWSFRPLAAVSPPDVGDSEWPAGPIDRFILKSLADADLQPSAEAERSTLVRRLYFDLTGLPPTEAELAAALGDRSEAWLASLVDRLLESERFGEHWGRKWLDIARYADSNGSDFNATFHDAWRYRNYVIDAYNADKPFDEFLREQLAGDLLPADSLAERQEHLVATGFLMLGTKMLSERDKEKLTLDVIDEQIDTTGRALLGMTLGCARCHDHKFDPIPTADYYALAGIFGSTRTLEGESQQYVSTWRKPKLPTSPEHQAAWNAYTAELKQADAKLKAAKKELAATDKRIAALGQPHDPLTRDDREARKTGTWVASTNSRPFVGPGYIHDGQTNKGDLRVDFTFEVAAAGEYEVQLAYRHAPGRAKRVPVTITQAVADGFQRTAFVNQEQRPSIDNLFAPVMRVELAAGQVTVSVSNENTAGYVIVDAVRLRPQFELPPDRSAEPVGNADERRRAEADRKTLAERVKQLEASKKTLQQNAPAPLPTVFAVGDRQEISDCEICIRGEVHNRGEAVPRGVLRVATDAPIAMPEESSGRLELADWIASNRNPLTARVYVNRIWSHLLGEGIVRTVDNFGMLGDRPSHPELLDYLAGRFVDESDWDWSTKRVIREIVLSRTYRQASTHREQDWTADPDNRLLWKARRRPLPAEAIRDTLLYVGGSLDESRGTETMRGFGTLVKDNKPDSKGTTAATTNRRSVYNAIVRGELPPILTAFDFADPDLVVGKRPVTNVPTQALLLLNSPLVIEQADRIAKELLGDAPAVQATHVESLYRRLYSRTPSDSEVDRAIAWVRSSGPKSERERFARFAHVLIAATEFRMLD